MPYLSDTLVLLKQPSGSCNTVFKFRLIFIQESPIPPRDHLGRGEEAHTNTAGFMVGRVNDKKRVAPEQWEHMALRRPTRSVGGRPF